MDEVASAAASRRAVRWRLRDRARTLGIQVLDRVADCGAPIGARVAIMSGAHGGNVAGVSTCGSVHSCPACAPIIRQGRTAELEYSIDKWHADDAGSVLLVTLTAPHTRYHGLDHGLNNLAAIWTKMMSARAGSELRDDLDLFGTAKSIDLTWSNRNGWHPHFHCVFFLKRHLDVETASLIIKQDWIDAAGLLGLDVRAEALDVQVVTPGTAGTTASYVLDAKSVALETVRHDLKRLGSGLSPWELLENACDGDKRARALWACYSQTMHGRHAIQYSLGLRAHFGLDDVADEELAEEHDHTAVVMGFLDARDWRYLRLRVGATDRVMLAAASGQLAAVCRDLGVTLIPPDG